MQRHHAFTIIATLLFTAAANAGTLRTRPALSIADLANFEYPAGFCFNPDLEVQEGESQEAFTDACLAGAGQLFEDRCQVASLGASPASSDAVGVFLRCTHVTGIDFPERQVFVWAIDGDRARLQELADSGELIRARFTGEYFGTLVSVEPVP